MSTLADLDEYLKSQNIPILGLSMSNPIRIDFAPEATDQQKIQARSIVDNFVFQKRIPKDEQSLFTEVNNFLDSTAKIKKAVAIALTKVLLQDPKLLQRFSESIVGDQPE
jgi:hypothetical protein